MSDVPAQPKIYHITHVENLATIARAGCIWSDAVRLERGCQCRLVGMSEIKRRRLEEIEVACHPGTKVGQYVPFYFCPRSIMLFLLHRGNHPDLDYHEGQGQMLHLQANLRQVVAWAEREGRRWAFTDRNAGMYYSLFYKDLYKLDKIDWRAVQTTDWRDPLAKEGKQAEFLVFEVFPWELVEKIGVADQASHMKVQEILVDSAHKPLVNLEPAWYY